MKGDRQTYIGNFLFALNAFIVFLLLFENNLIVPRWLQPLGRMHPLILHFPIVLLLLSMVMEFFRFKTSNQAQEFYRSFTSNLLLTGVITSGITVIMGIFLSQEEGYNASVLSWHKWSGVSVFFIASAIYTCRNSAWYKAPVAKAGALITAISLLFAGHFGAALTHGDNFIWQPVIAQEQKVVPLEEARIFQHVIRPVLEKKCVSCHNAEKLKGKLMLTDSVSLLKGGKTGELFVAGEPELSLLLKRINLPLEEKKHMPPSGKAQLTDNETELFYLWIKSGAPFNTRVTALPTFDSLRQLASAFLVPEDDEGEQFEFPSASQQALEKLNSNYRVVSPIARESPALTVNIYNKDSYTPKTLDELKDVKLQIISLDLSKMPVRNEDLKFITRFENLRRLNLNFTEVTGAGLPALAELKHLNSLSLSGTKVEFRDLQENLSLFESLHNLAIWDTPVSATEIKQLQTTYKHVEVLGGSDDDTDYLIKLNPPRLKNKTIVFDDSILLHLFHPVKEVEIRFTVDGTDPDSINSSLFTENTILKESAAIKARAYKQGWLSSDIASLNVYRNAHKPDTVILLSRLNRVHPANGAQTFFDHELGSFNANSPAWANNWAGFLRNDMELMLRYDSPRRVSSVSLNTLIETENVIFPPAVIEIWGGPSESSLHLISRVKPDLPVDYRKPFINLFDCKFAPQDVSCLKIIAKPVLKLPAWHKNKDRAGLLLIDEILIN
ncbi:MAG: DUF2231 domain-containing protein [Cyclobacteriaceae bacterium]